MALRPEGIVQLPFLYPTGHTRAVCLTETLPPEHDATVLLLGCGDVRNLLCTVHSNTGSNNTRKLDFTCCDIEAEIIARNIFILTLMIDAPEAVPAIKLWNIYHHVFLDAQDSELLQKHAKKLVNYAISLNKWNESSFSAVIRFCDSDTLADVARMWQMYAMDKSDSAAYNKTQAMLKSQWEAAKRFHNQRLDSSSALLNSAGSSLPLVDEGINDAPKQHRIYWQSGTSFEDRKIIKKLKIANPLFGWLRTNLVLDYSTSPTGGYPLATAYTQLSSDSLCVTPGAKTLGISKAFQAALGHFDAWCNAMRKEQDRVTIRYANADAISFCHVLQHRNTHGQTPTANWYRSSRTYTPFVLDSADYRKRGSAPTRFNVIETSNLLGHIGALNILVASSPLLQQQPSSTLRTGVLIPPKTDVSESMKALLCGDLPTVALLMGLKPVQYWSNATAVWYMSEPMQQKFPHGNRLANDLSRPIMLWKPTNISKVRFDPKELSQLLYKVYLAMFQDESWSNRLQMHRSQDAGLLIKNLGSFEVYSRASFATLLKSIKSSRYVDFHPFISDLLSKIQFDPILNMGPHNFQSLITQLEVLSVIDPSAVFDWWAPKTFLHDLRGPFAAWTDIPPTICVTLVVPKRAVALWDDLSKDNGTPLCEMQIQSTTSTKQATYTDINIGFGTVKTSGTAFTNDFVLTVKNDPAGWKGQSPLIVSAMVSTCALVEYGDASGKVVFQLKSTPASTAGFISRLGMFLHIHESNVGNKDVFITRYKPNLQGYSSVGALGPSGQTLLEENAVSIKPKFRTAIYEIHALEVRLHINSDMATKKLQSGGIVNVRSVDPWTVEFVIDEAIVKRVTLPLPIDSAAAKVKIARKSLWIEYLVPVASAKALAVRQDMLFPIRPDSVSRFSLETLHYLDIDLLPKLQLGPHASWLNLHASIDATMSSAEKAAYEWFNSNNRLAMPGRLAMKETLSNMWDLLFGINGTEKVRIFNLHSKSRLAVLLYVDAVRLDLANGTVLVDGAACSPSSLDSMSAVGAKTTEIEKTGTLHMGANEARCWEALLCASAERCRQWKHKDGCEYIAEGAAPIPLGSGARWMCSCGQGVFPKGYLSDKKDFRHFSKYSVRVVIPLVFASPMSAYGAGIYELTPPASSARQHDENALSNLMENMMANMMADVPRCHMCRAYEGKDSKELSQCARCKLVRYCSKDCQKTHWKEHKKVCKK